jgi:hypothetical protein
LYKEVKRILKRAQDRITSADLPGNVKLHKQRIEDHFAPFAEV